MTLSKVEKMELVSFIERSPNRIKIIELLKDSRLLTPTEISNKTEISTQNVSRNLKKLQEKDLINCINESAHKYKYYEITDRGKQILEEKEQR